MVGFGVGSFVGVLLALLAVAIAKPERQPAVADALLPTVTATPAPEGPTATAVPAVKTKAALAVHIGPGDAYAIIGTTARGENVEVLGRDGNGDWVAVRFPPGSTARGWVPASQLENLGGSDIDKLAVLMPTPLAQTVATPSVGRFDSSLDNPEVTGPVSTPAISSSPRPAAPKPTVAPSGSDLVVDRLSVLDDGRVSVVIGNRGPADVVGRQIFVQLRDLGAQSELLIYNGRLDAGATMSLTSSVIRVMAEGELIATVDPGGVLNDPVRGNNTLRQSVAPTGAAPVAAR